MANAIYLSYGQGTGLGSLGHNIYAHVGDINEIESCLKNYPGLELFVKEAENASQEDSMQTVREMHKYIDENTGWRPASYLGCWDLPEEMQEISDEYGMMYQPGFLCEDGEKVIMEKFKLLHDKLYPAFLEFAQSRGFRKVELKK